MGIGNVRSARAATNWTGSEARCNQRAEKKTN